MTLLPPGPHGGDAWRLAQRLGIDVADVLDLSASLNPLAPDLTALLAANLDSYRRYPSDHEATGALAAAIGVDPARLVLTNGGAEAIALAAALAPEGWVDDPDFSLYRRHLARLRPGAPRWRSDPHNPTGRLAPAAEWWEVRDEAFYPLATGTWTRGDEGSLVLGSLTKLFACPGLRLGYAIARDDREADELRGRRPAWSVGGLAAAVVPPLLEQADLRRWAAGVAELRAQLVDLLRGHGLEPEPSDANYVWVPHAPGLREQLLPRRVVVRSGASFGHPDAVRVAVPDAAGLERLADALAGGHGP